MSRQNALNHNGVWYEIHDDRKDNPNPTKVREKGSYYSSRIVPEALWTSIFLLLLLRLLVEPLKMPLEDIAHDDTEAIGGNTDRV